MKKLVLNIISYCFIVLLLEFFIGCSGHNVKRSVPVEVMRFELDVEGFSSLDSAEQDQFNLRYHPLLALFGQQCFSNDVCDSIMQTRIFVTFKDDVKAAFSNIDTLRNDLGEMKSNYETIFPDAKFPEIITAILPYNQSVIGTDSAVVISLNHYLGAAHPMYECYEPYIRLEKEKRMIPVHVAELLVNNKMLEMLHNQCTTLLDFIISEGVRLKLEQMLLGSRDIEDLLGWNKQSTQWVEKNEQMLWNTLVSQDILYSSSSLVIGNMLRPGAYSPVFGTACPSRIGAWIGVRIVEKYCKEKDRDFINSYREILTTNSQTILINSEYNGR